MLSPFAYYPMNNTQPGELRVNENYRGCGTKCPPDPQFTSRLRGVSPVPSGTYMGAIGKVVSMGGLGCPTMQPSPTARAQGAMAMMGMRGLGDAAADRAACLGITGALQAGAGIAQGVHTGSAPAGGTPDAGWTTAIGTFTSLAQTASSMCQTIQTGSAVVPASPPGASPAWMTPQPPPPPPPRDNTLLYVGGGVAALVVLALVLR